MRGERDEGERVVELAGQFCPLLVTTASALKCVINTALLNE